jgi:hypothetical protein
MSAMKMNNTKALIWTLLAPIASIFCTPAVWADAPTAAVKADSSRSVFVVPASPKEGCDPFFPDSNRLFETLAPPPKHGIEATSLVFRGISGSPTHPFAIINNHTFAQGDDGDVLTPEGRIHVRCIEIKQNSVLVEYNGQRHELTFSAK